MRTFLVIFALLLAVGSAAAVSAQPSQPRLYLYSRERLRAPASFAAELGRAAPGPYAIVQLRGPVAEADRAALAGTGVELIEYLPDFAFLVRGEPAQLDAAARLPQIAARLPFTAADKLAPALLSALVGSGALPGPLRVSGWPGQTGALERDLRRAGLAPEAPANTATLWRLAALPAVRWIEPAGRPRLLNDVARSLMHTSAAWKTRGLYGAGQTIAIADSGLDTGKLSTLSPDFAGRLVATHLVALGGDRAATCGHGTHVAGSAAGSGAQSGAKPGSHTYDGSFAGVAPEAKLVIQAFEVGSDSSVVGLDPDYYTLFAQAYADGARLHSDSWGDTTGPETDLEAQYGGYPSGARRTDQFVWDHPDMAIFVAAGNSGIDGVPSGPFGFCSAGNGVIDPDSLLSPGTAKNVITVGASESQRSSGGASQLLWVYLDLSFCLSTEPIASDTTSDDPLGMAAFSSRGPTDDGRIKPDLVAPGTNILSNRSHASGAGALWGEYPDNPHYLYSGGTSMATPLVAGSGALVREWLAGRGIAQPSAAAVKATLLNTTVDLAPGQYGTSATREIPAARPNSVDGWGRADLGFLAAAAPYTLWVDDYAPGLATGQVAEYATSAERPLEVRSSKVPLRVMLAWSDPPASPSAARQLVNDLDLTVIGPGNVVYRGNRAANGDRLNNVEGIVIDQPAVGRYVVRVRGYNVPVSRQPYALAVAGALDSSAPAPGTPQLFIPLIVR